MIDKNKALEAWKRLDAIIDDLDWSGALANSEMCTVEESMNIIYQFIKEE